MSKILAIDFDGTVAVNEFPDIGEPIELAFEVMKELQEAGYILVLNTCREDEKKRKYLTEAVDFCRERGIEFRSVNENHRDDDFRENGGRKIYAHRYIDDKNIGGFIGWAKIRELLL